MKTIKTTGVSENDLIASTSTTKPQHTPTFLCDAAYLEGGCSEHERLGGMPGSYGGPMDWMTRHAHRRRLQRLTVDQGSSTLDKEAGDFENLR